MSASLTPVFSETSHEGDYTSWAEIWNISGAAINNINLHNRGGVSGSRVFFIDMWNLATYVREIADGSAVDSDSFATTLSGGLNNAIAQSVFGKYMCRISGAAQVEVWKDGVLQQTINIGGTTPDLQGILMSADGQYLLIADEDNDIIYCYQGS